MASDRVVTPRDVLDALTRVRRLGIERSLQETEQQEPDLAEFILEELSIVHRRLAESGAPARRLRRLTRQIESLVLVSTLAVRQAHRRLWNEQAIGTPLAQLNSSVTEPHDPPSASQDSPDS